MPQEDRCPRCDSPRPHLHPAMQHGGEVQVCQHPYHKTITPENTPERIAAAVATQGVPDTVISDEMLAAFAKDAQTLLDRGINVSIVPGAANNRRIRLRVSSSSEDGTPPEWHVDSYLTDDETDILASMLESMAASARTIKSSGNGEWSPSQFIPPRGSKP